MPVVRGAIAGLSAGLAVLLLAAPCAAQRAAGGGAERAADRVSAAVDARTVDRDLRILASDSFEGRAPGTRGGARAAAFVADEFRRAGLEPAGDGGGWLQRFSYRDTAGREIRTANVVARWPGTARAGALRDEVVVLGAHYDHLGIGPAEAGDSIYNGAVDDAAGVAALVALAEAFARSGVHGGRALVFVAFGAEEAGLVGSRAFVRQMAHTGAGRVVAMLNFEGVNLFGATRDAWALGIGWSTLGPLFRRAALAEGLAVPDSLAENRDAFYRRSDQLAFAEAGIPALMTWPGRDFVGRAPGWADSLFADYFAHRYHRPSDEVLPEHTAAGAVQQIRLFARTALAAADAPARPAWLPGAPFPERAAGR